MSQQKPASHRIDWRGADLRNVNMAGVSLEGADLRAADLSGSNFTGANLRYADFRGATLNGTNFQNANLYGAKMQGVEANQTDFQGANVQLANFGGAYLDGAILPPAAAKTVLPSPSEIANQPASPAGQAHRHERGNGRGD